MNSALNTVLLPVVMVSVAVLTAMAVMVRARTAPARPTIRSTWRTPMGRWMYVLAAVVVVLITVLFVDGDARPRRLLIVAVPAAVGAVVGNYLESRRVKTLNGLRGTGGDDVGGAVRR